MSHKSTLPGGSFHPRPHFIVLTLTKRTHGLGLGLGLGFKYISMILKGSEQTLDLVDAFLSLYQVRVRVQIHQHGIQGQRMSAVFCGFPFYHCISRHGLGLRGGGDMFPQDS